MTPYTDQLKDLLAKVTPGEWNVSGAFVVTDDVIVTLACHRVESDATLIALAPTLAAEVMRLRVALEEISGRHIPHPPAAYGGDEYEWAKRQHTELRRIARQALDDTGAV